MFLITSTNEQRCQTRQNYLTNQATINSTVEVAVPDLSRKNKTTLSPYSPSQHLTQTRTYQNNKKQFDLGFFPQ